MERLSKEFKEHQDKQAQRKLINEAIKDYLARGGTITKLDANQVEPDYNITGQSDEIDQFSEFQFTESPGLLVAGNGTKLFDL